MRLRQLALAVIVLAFGSATAQPPPEQPKASAQPEQKPAELKPFAIEIPGGIELKDSAASEDREKARDQREADDLRAQQWMAGAAIFQAAFSVVSVILLGVTIFYSHKAWGEAKASAQAARQTLYNERAWLMPMPGANQHRQRLDNSFWNGIPFSGERLVLLIVNSGKTPASGVRLFANQSIQPLTGPLEPDYPLIYGDRGEYHGVAPPNGSPCGVSVMISDENVRLFRERQCRGFVYFKVQYNDIFEPTKLRETEMCFEIIHSGIIITPQGNVDGWSYRPVERFAKTT